MNEQTPLAIVGIGCRLPGAKNVDELWKVLTDGRCTVGEMPPERLNEEIYFDPEKGLVGRTYSKAAGTIEFQSPDPSQVDLPDQSNTKNDPGHLSFCNTTAEALQNAGYDLKNVPCKSTGVFLGHTRGSDTPGDMVYGTCSEEALSEASQIPEFQDLFGENPEIARKIFGDAAQEIRSALPHLTKGVGTRVCSHHGALLVANTFGFTGPVCAINAACASSLQALAIAGRALRRGSIRMAVVGGASFCSLDSMVLFSKAHSISPNDSRPFDAKADGLLVSEGHVVLVVKTLEAALEDGDNIQAVIRGIGVSSDGKGKSLWAPRKEGQVLAIDRAYQGSVDPQYLQLVEAHATSTQVGDATEMAALIESLTDRIKPNRIPVGSIKANVGHTLETAGIAGLLKVILALKHKTIPKQINCHELNPRIDWDRAPFYVPSENQQWPENVDGRPRLAAVNAFGIGGLNTHVVVEEFQPKTHRSRVDVKPACPQQEDAIAVVGISAILPGARTVEEFAKLLQSNHDPKSHVQKRWKPEYSLSDKPELYHSTGTLGGFLEDYEYDWRKHRVPPKEIASANPLQFMILDAVDAALDDAGMTPDTYDRTKASVIVGSQFGSDFSTDLVMGVRVPEMQLALAKQLTSKGIPRAKVDQIVEQFGELILKLKPALLDETGSFTSSTLASRITKMFDLMGGALAIDTGDASTGTAIATAADILLSGEMDTVICAAGQRSMGLPVFEGISMCDALVHHSDRSAFSGNAPGVAPGEGVGVMILQRLSDAQKANRKIHAVIRGVGSGSGAKPSEGLAAAVSRLSSQRLPKADIIQVASAGSECDEETFESFAELCPATSTTPYLHSVTPRTGHCGGGSGMIALLAAIEQMKQRHAFADFPQLQSPQQLQVGERKFQLSGGALPGHHQPIQSIVADWDPSGPANIFLLEPAGQPAEKRSDDPQEDSVNRDTVHLNGKHSSHTVSVKQATQLEAAPDFREPERVHMPLAIVGMACHLPDSPNLSAYWNLILEGRSAIGQLPSARLNRRLYFKAQRGEPGRTYSSIGALSPHRAQAFQKFLLSDEDVLNADPCHLELCQIVADAFQHAQMDPHKTAGTRTGVYMGHTQGTSLNGDLTFASMLPQGLSILRSLPAFDRIAGSNAETWVEEIAHRLRDQLPSRNDGGGPFVEASQAANLVAKSFGLLGTTMSLNAACSSGLVALAYAAHALELGQIDAAVVGASSSLKLENLLLFSKAQSISGTGSRPFDNTADGLVTAEGHVTCIVKTLEKALSDGDPIHAVIRGIGLSSDGKGKSLWAPLREGQAEALRRAYSSDVPPDSVQYIETHATSTLVGDSTELLALSDVIGTSLAKGQKIPIGSVKANIGHTLEPAGLAGLVKTVLAMKAQTIPPVANVTQPNSRIDWSNLPFSLPLSAQPWQLPASGGSRRAAVNAFGVGGLNAHVVVDEFDRSRSTQVAVPKFPQQATTPEERSLAIVAAEVLVPGAKSLKEFWEIVRAGENQRTAVPKERWEPSLLSAGTASQWKGGFLRDFDYDWRKHRIPPLQIAAADPLQFMLLDTVDRALESSGFLSKLDRSSTAVVVGNEVGGEFYDQLQFVIRLPEVQEAFRQLLSENGTREDEIESALNAFQQKVHDRFPALNDDTGSFTNSSLASRITKTFDLLGGACAVDSGATSSFAAIQVAQNLLLSRACDTVICAAGQRSMGIGAYQKLLSANRSKEVPGEGTGVVILKRFPDAQRDGDKILGVIRDVRIERTPSSATEDKAIKSDISSQFGNLSGTTGMISLLKEIVRSNDTRTSANEDSSEEVKVALHPVKLSQTDLSGQRCQLELLAPSQGAQDTSLPKENPWKAAVLEAATVSDLLSTAEAILKSASPFAELESRAADRTAPYAVGLVARSDEELRQKLQALVKYFEHPTRDSIWEGQGIYFVSRGTQAKVAFLFPGQGSQYAGMLQDLVQSDPTVQQTVQKLDRTLQSLGYPTYENLVVTNADQLGEDVFRTQLALLVADAILLDVVRNLGITPDVITAHSYGEFPALYASGVWSFREAALATKLRCDSIDETPAIDGAMLSCQIDLETAQQLCQSHNGDVHIANRNSLQQIVLSGKRANLEALERTLTNQGIRCRLLKVPRPYHSPLMKSAQPIFKQRLDSISFNGITTPLFSSIDGEYASNSDRIRGNLVEQLTRQVDFVHQIEHLRSEGVNVFVEVGPSTVLSDLTRSIVKDPNIVVVSSNHKRRSDGESLARLKAAMLAKGALESQPDKSTMNTTQSLPDELRIARLSGSRYQMGKTHGEMFAREIKACLQRVCDLADSQTARSLPSLDSAWKLRDDLFDADAVDEIRGIADGAGVNIESVIAHNMRGYFDIETGCVQVLLREVDKPNTCIHAANEDLPLALYLRETLKRCVQIRHPEQGNAHVVFSPVGHARAINGVNAAGVAITSSKLLDLPRRIETSRGLLHGELILKLLQFSNSIDDVVEHLERYPKTGAWGLFVSNAKRNQHVYLEYDGNQIRQENVASDTFATNHARLFTPIEEVPAHSLRRLERLQQLHRNGPPSRNTVQTWLRDRFDIGRNKEARFPTMTTIRRVDNQISVVFDTVNAKAWITPGTHSGLDENQFYELDLHQLIGLSPMTPQSTSINDEEGEVQSLDRDVYISPESFHEQVQSFNGASPRPTSGNVCERFVVRVIPQNRLEPASDLQRLSGGVIILGNSRVATALQQRLRQQGISTTLVDNLHDIDAAIKKIDAACEKGPIPNLILLSDWNEGPDFGLAEVAWNKLRDEKVLNPYLACQRWFTHLNKAKQVARGSFLAATCLGGQLGFNDRHRSPLGGFVTGMHKGLAVEQGRTTDWQFQTNLVDFEPTASPDFIADRLLEEFQSGNACNQEIGYVGEQRYRVVTIPQPIEMLPEQSRSFGKNWVITGGARGVTAAVAKAIGKRYGVTLHLIGSSPLPQVDPAWRDFDEAQTKELRAKVMKQAIADGAVPIQAWERVEKGIEIDRNLAEMKAMGLQVNYYPCDITNRSALASLLESIRAKHGEIDGIIHGAGYEKAASFHNKKADNVKRTVGSKVDGAVALMELTSNDPLKYFVAFSSISGRFGGTGQTDYCLSNELLSKLIGWYRRRRPDVASVAIDWHSWDEVGMAVRPETKFAKEFAHMTFMPTLEGTNHLIDELLRGCPEPEVVITDWNYFKLQFPDDRLEELAPNVAVAPPGVIKQSDRNVSLDDSTAIIENLISQLDAGQKQGEVAIPHPNHPGQIIRFTASTEAKGDESAIWPLPFVDSVVFQDAEQVRVRMISQPASDRFLQEHMFKSRPIFPLVGFADACAQAATLLMKDSSFAVLEDLEVKQAWRLLTDDPAESNIQVTRTEQGIICEFLTDFCNRKGIVLQKDRVHFRCVVKEDAELPIDEPVPFPPGYHDVNYPEDRLVLYHGPMYRQVRGVYYDGNISWFRVNVPDPQEFYGERSTGRTFLPAILIDACFFAAGIHFWLGESAAVVLPTGIQRLSLIDLPAPGTEAYAYIRLRERSETQAVFDIDLRDGEGRLLMKIEGYEGVIVMTNPAISQEGSPIA